MREEICKGNTLWDFCVSGEAIIFDDQSPPTLQDCKNKILVVNAPSPDIIIYMKECTAIITETGGLLCHAAVLALEIGCPIVVAVASAKKLIHTGEMLTIHSTGHEGCIYEKIL